MNNVFNKKLNGHSRNTAAERLHNSIGNRPGVIAHLEPLIEVL
jgi:hypothetical protein